MKPTRSVRLLALSVSLAFLPLLGSCDRSSGTRLLGPRTYGLGDPGYVAFQHPIPGDLTDQWCVFLEPGADVEAIADALDAVVLRHDAALDLALLQAPVDAGDFQELTGIREVQENAPSIWSIPVELTLGFSQGDWSFEEVKGQSALTPLRLPEVHSYSEGKGIRVAVLDTGVDPSHPHLRDRVELLGPGAILGSLETPNGIDDDGNGTADDAYGHGTHVAGTVLTVAPSAKVLSIRVLNEEGWGTLYDLAAALQLVREMDVDVVNLSLILSEPSSLIDTLIDELLGRDIVTVGAAGNTPLVVGYPASYPFCLGVAAADTSDCLASFSGAYTATAAAPGVAVASSFPGDKIAWGTGTSMATAVTSGCLAVVASYYQPNGNIWSGLLMLEAGEDTAPPGAVAFGYVRPLRALWVAGQDRILGR